MTDLNICAELRQGIVTTSAEQTRQLARRLATTIPVDTALALHGNLGVGKTTFVQGLAAGLGIQESVTSPTFNLYGLHRGPRGSLLHLDAYRLEGGAQVEALMLEDFLATPWIMAIEWPEKIADWLPASAWHFDLEINPNESHTIKLRGE